MSYYETSQNRSHESEIATAAGLRWSLEPIEAPVFCVVDGLFLKNGKPYAFFEIKKRSYALSQLSSVFIDKAKLDKAYRGAERMGCNLILLFEFEDGRFFCPITSMPDFEVTIGGPQTKRDDYDRDEIYLVPQSSWQSL